MMYLRPGNQYKDFIVEESVEEVNQKTGRPRTAYNDNGLNMFKGALAQADPRQKSRWEQLQHPISHVIIHHGQPLAKAEDKLVLGERVFFVQGVDDIGSLGISTLYYVEERADVK